MNNEKIYVCTHCQQWLRPHPDVEPKACPFCNGKLEHVPVTAEEFNGWDEATKKALAQTYAAPKEAQPAAAEQPAQADEAQKAATEFNQQNSKPMKKGCFSSIFAYIFYIVVSIGVFYLLSNVGNWIHQNDSLQRNASISLNALIDSQQPLPEGEFVSLDTRWVIGPIATETSTSSWGSSDGLTATTGVDYYYYAILEDGTIMAIQTSNSKEVETLDRMSEWLLDVYGYPMDGETILLQGKLKQMTEREIISIYNEYLYIFELEPNDPSVHYLILDTTAGRIGNVLVIGAVVALIAIVVLVRVSAKKKAAKKAAA